MNSTALGAENIIFISDAHEKFYYEKLKEVRYQDVYHKALCYCIGINNDTRRNADRIYDFKTGCVKTECLYEGWQTSGSVKVVRMAFNLYCNATPSVDDYKDAEEQINECSTETSWRSRGYRAGKGIKAGCAYEVFRGEFPTWSQSSGSQAVQQMYERCRRYSPFHYYQCQLKTCIS